MNNDLSVAILQRFRGVSWIRKEKFVQENWMESSGAGICPTGGDFQGWILRLAQDPPEGENKGRVPQGKIPKFHRLKKLVCINKRRGEENERPSALFLQDLLR
jgi:hypothetical protein